MTKPTLLANDDDTNDENSAKAMKDDENHVPMMKPGEPPVHMGKNGDNVEKDDGDAGERDHVPRRPRAAPLTGVVVPGNVDNSGKNVDNVARFVDKSTQGDGVWRPEKLELAAPAATRPPARTYLEQKQERTERLLGRYASLADLLGLDRLPEIDCCGFKRILDVGTREGNWAIAMARKYPRVWVLGIDGSPSAIARAESVAAAEGLLNIAFMVRQVEELLLAGFTVRHFNLVRLHCLAGEITPLQLPPLVHAATNVCVRSGMVLWSELELPLTNSDPCERFCEVLVAALQRQRRGFGPGRTLGITPLMGVWLKLAGCRILQDQAHVVDVSAGTAQRADFLRYLCDLGQQMRGFVVANGVLSEKEYDELLARALIDVQALTFCGLCYARTVLGVRESSRDPLRNKISW